MRPVIRHFWLLVGLVFWAAGCAPPTPPPTSTPPATPAAQTQPTATPSPTLTPMPSATPTRPPLPTDTPSIVTITVWENLPPPQAEQLARDITAFGGQFSQYAVELTHFDTPEDFLAATRDNPADFDVVLATPMLLARLVAQRQLAPMSDFFPPAFLDEFAAVTLLGATQNEQVWGLPETAGFHLLLFYNKSLVDTPPVTTADLAEQAKTLTSGTQWGLGINSFEPLWLVPWLTPFGGWLINADDQPTLNTPAMVQALELVQGWQTPPNAVAPVATYDEMQSKFVAGNVALMINGDWAVGELRTSPELNWGVAPLPAVGSADDNQPAASLVLAKYWAISRSATAERALAASAFVDFVTRPDRQLAWAAKFGTLPTRRDALNDPLIVNDAVRRVSAAQLLAGQSLPLGIDANVLLDAMRGPLQQVLAGQLSPAKAAEQMQANLESQ